VHNNCASVKGKMEWEQDNSTEGTLPADGEVGRSPGTSPNPRSYIPPSSNASNKNDDWTFDCDKVRKIIDKMRSRVKVKFTQKNKKRRK
jgi:hypothetical protein